MDEKNYLTRKAATTMNISIFQPMQKIYTEKTKFSRLKWKKKWQTQSRKWLMSSTGAPQTK